ncbi:MAG: BTAD domain-containing putative transcriptional regulator [Mycobacterium sp.]
MVEYFLSGAIEARVDGSVAALGGAKQRCVLAVLLANHGSVVSIDALVDAVWVDDAPPKALASVRSYVANLRRVLEDTDHDGTRRLESRPFGYRLNLLADDSVDLHRFEELVSVGRTALIRNDPHCAVATLSEALALWHGDPFGEFGYRDFAAHEVVRFAALRITAIEARLDAALQTGGGAELVPDIEAAVALHPMQERLWGHLMLALYRAGRTADAVRAFDRACTTLAQEIGNEPGDGLQILFAKISDRSPDLHVQPLRPTIVAQAAAATPPPLLGRDSELDALQPTGRGSGGLTLVTGESGIGKTSLALAIARLGPTAGVAVAWAAHPAGIRLPLMWTWIQLLRQLGSELGEPAREAVCRAAPGVVNALVPEWNQRDAPPSAAATGFALMEGIVTALRTLAGSRPLLLILDDLQLADTTSLDTLSLLAAEFPRIAIQVIGNWTFYGADRPINRQSLEVLLKSNDTTTVHLDGIDRDAAANLVDEFANSPTPQDVSEHMWRQTGGNPFYLKELARARDAGAARQHPAEQDMAGLPDAVVGVIGRRLGVLEPPSRRVLSAAAVVGPEFDVADLSDIVELSISTVQWRLRPAYEAGLIDEVPAHPGAYRFSHGLFRDAVLAQLPIPDRTALHAAVATTRAATLATAAYELGIAAADHAWRAGAELSPDTAVEIHETVIARALTRSAYDDVAALVEHALQICTRLPAKPEHLERQATLWLHLSGAKGILEGQASTAAADAVQRALEIGREVKGRSFYGAIALQCVMLCAHGRIDETQVIATGLRGQYEASGDPGIGVASGFAQVMIHALRGDVDALISSGQHMMATFPPPETVADPMHFFHPRVYCWMALGEAMRGDRVAMRDYAQQALQLAQSRGDVFNILAAKLSLVESAAILGDVTGTAAAADAVEREFNAAGGHQWGAAAKIIGVWAQILDTGTGDPASAFDAFDVLTADGTSVMNALFLGLLADIETHYGRTKHAHELLSRAQMLAETTGEHAWDEFIGRRLAVTQPGLRGRDHCADVEVRRCSTNW